MLTFTLDQVKDTYSPKDLVPITIQSVTNPHSNKKTGKYIIHVNGDTFGLFSDRYVFCSTKHIIEKFQKFKLDHFRYNGGFITAYLSTEKENGLNADEDTKKILKILYEESEILDADLNFEVFLINSYTGTRKLTVGSSLKVKFNNYNLHVKINISDIDNSHVASLLTTLEKDLEVTSNIDEILNIDTIYSRELLKQNVNKKQKETIDYILSRIDNPKTLHVLIIMAYLDLPIQKEINILSNLTKFISKKGD